MKKIKLLLVVTTLTCSLSFLNAFAYDSVHNQSLGKMEMLEVIDKHIKNSITKDISFLKSEVSKLKQKSPSGKHKRKLSKDELYDVKGDISDNRSKIRSLDSKLSEISRRLGRVEDLLNQISSRKMESSNE